MCNEAKDCKFVVGDRWKDREGNELTITAINTQDLWPVKAVCTYSNRQTHIVGELLEYGMDGESEYGKAFRYLDLVEKL